jgi:thiosulfate/3-mercaptopyruvate sulfurtransferase
MRHSVSIPFNALLATHEMTAGGAQGTYTTLLGSNELRKTMVDLLDKSGRNGEEVVDLILQGEQTVVASCGSGMTAAVIWLALQEMGVNRTVPLYDEVRVDIGSEFVHYASISRAPTNE